MRLFDRMVGLKLPPPGTAPAPRAAVLGALLALDRDTAPYTVRRGSGGTDGDVAADWRLADPRWRPVFAGRIEESVTIALWLHEAEAQVRCLQRSRGLRWDGGAPVATAAWSQVRGAYADASFGRAPAAVELTATGERIAYDLRPGEVRRPLEAAVTGQGWSFRGVGLRRR